MQKNSIILAIFAVICVECLADGTCPAYKFGKPEKKEEGETITCLETVTDESGSDTILVTGCPRGMLCNTGNGECYDGTPYDELLTFFQTKTGLPGSRCDINADCIGSICENSRCVGGSENEACADISDCNPNFYCVSKACVPYKKPGEECAEDKECGIVSLCNSDNTCAAFLSLDVGAPSKDALLCKSATIVGEVCVGAIRSKPTEDADACMYEDTETGEVFADNLVSQECTYSERSERVCMVALGDRPMRRIIDQAANLVEKVLKHGTSCHYYSSTPCVDELEDFRKQIDEDETKEMHYSGKQMEVIRETLSFLKLNELQETQTSLTKITGKERDNFIAEAYEPAVLMLVMEHGGFPWMTVLIGSTLVIGAGAAAYLYFMQ